MILNNLNIIKICQCYHFNNCTHFDEFIINFKEKKAYWDPQYFKDLELKNEIFEENKGISYIEQKGHDLFLTLHNRVSNDNFILDYENIGEFMVFLEESDLLNQLLDGIFYLHGDSNIPNDILEAVHLLKSNNRDKLDMISLINECILTFCTDDFEIEFLVNFSFPDSWFDFAGALEKLVGFDILNINNSKYWVNNINYILSPNGVIDKINGKKLELNKFKFNFSSWGFNNHMPSVIIDLKNELLILKDYGEILSSEKLTQEHLNDFKDLLVKHDVYLWGYEELYRNVLKTGSIYDGFNWNIELVFNNDAIFYVGLRNGFPDSYLAFAKDVKELFDNDLIGFQNCYDFQKFFYD